MIYLRNALMAGGGRRNPYPVMDACTNWWDGEWNVALGKHDAATIEWKDLVGDINLSILGGATVESNAVSFPYYRNNDNNGPRAVYSANVSTPKTMEMVCWADKYQTSQYANRLTILCVSSSYIVGGYNYNASTGINIGGARTTAIDFSDSRLFHCAYDSEAKKIYVNGEAVAELTFSSYGMSSVFCVGNFRRSNASRVYTLRFHSRALTSDEIAANYNIDKARFNLP